MPFSLDHVYRTAYVVAADSPDELNPHEDGVCTYFGPDGTTCLGGQVLRALGIPLPLENTGVSHSPGLPGQFEPDALSFLQNLQSLADQGYVVSVGGGEYDFSEPDPTKRLPWWTAYERACGMHELPTQPEAR